jgi:DNA-binding NtrC family response regulator
MENANIRVLMVEDSEDDAYLSERILRQHGFCPECRRVETAEAMQQALSNESWDLILSDYLMPSFNAMGALELYQEADLDIPFIVVSGSIGEDVAVEAMKSGVHDYLLKDNLTRLAVAVERELHAARSRREQRVLADSLSHTIKNALQTISHSTELALQQAGENPALRDTLQQALNAARQALDAIERLAVDKKRSATAR